MGVAYILYTVLLQMRRPPAHRMFLTVARGVGSNRELPLETHGVAGGVVTKRMVKIFQIAPLLPCENFRQSRTFLLFFSFRRCFC